MPAKVRQNLYPAPPFMPTGMNIIAAQRQYRWPQAKISFSKFPPQKTKQALGNNLPMPAKVRQNLYPAPPFMPARHEYRCRAAAISLADRQKYRSPNSPPQKTNQALGKTPPNARKSSSELIRRPHVHAVRIRILHNLCRVARVHAPLVAQRIAAADGEVDTRATRVRAVVALPEG